MTFMREVRANHDRLVPLLIDPGENPNDEPIHEHWDEHHAQIEAWLHANGHAQSDDVARAQSRDLYEELRRSAVETAIGVPERVRDEPGVCGSWSLKELMGHLAFWDGRVADRLAAAKGGPPFRAIRGATTSSTPRRPRPAPHAHGMRFSPSWRNPIPVSCRS